MTDSTAAQVPKSGGDAVLVEQRGHVLLVTINRPDARNAVNTKVTLGIGEALDYADSSADVWVVIVTGAGDRSFCAGQDLKEAAAGIHLDDPRTERWGFAGFVKHAISKPVIAVPTSVGYGASFGGLAALLGMLNSCGSGVTVVNIDNGFGAGYAASQINALVELSSLKPAE